MRIKKLSDLFIVSDEHSDGVTALRDARREVLSLSDDQLTALYRRSLGQARDGLDDDELTVLLVTALASLLELAARGKSGPFNQE
jgi:hypothetical protein